MLKKLFMSWLVTVLIAAIFLFGAGFYISHHPDFAVGSVKGLYWLGTASLFLWLVGGVIENNG